MKKRETDADNMYEELDPEEKRLMILKRLGITVLIILGILVIFMFLRSCDRTEKGDDTSLNKTLLEAGKEYYEYNKHELPNSIGECSKVDLEVLSKNGLVNKTDYDDCENSTTYVKVCKLQSGKYQFVAFMDCESEDTESLYKEWNKGTEKDLVVDSSDIKFKYLVQYLNTDDSNSTNNIEEYWEDEIPYKTYKTESVVKYYRYRDTQYIWNVESKNYYPKDAVSASNVKEYYISSPATGYDNKDSENTKVSKYFSTTEEKVYWLKNGAKNYSPTKPNNEYIYKDEESGVKDTRYKTRTWTETSKPTPVGPTQMWYCSRPTDSSQVTSYVPCENIVNNPEYTVTERMIYTCDNGLTEVGKDGKCYQCPEGSGLNTGRTSCGSYSAWGSYTKDVCDITKKDICTSATVHMYNWYKLVGGAKSYYPSNASTAAGENTYYASSPQEGLIEDTSTTTTGWKWYKKKNTKTEEYYAVAPQTGATKTGTSRISSWSSWSTSSPANLGSGIRETQTRNKIRLREIIVASGTESWVDFSEDYMELEDLILALQEKGYKINSLDDISLSGELKYKVELYIRNKEVK